MHVHVHVRIRACACADVGTHGLQRANNARYTARTGAVAVLKIVSVAAAGVSVECAFAKLAEAAAVTSSTRAVATPAGSAWPEGSRGVVVSEADVAELSVGLVGATVAVDGTFAGIGWAGECVLWSVIVGCAAAWTAETVLHDVSVLLWAETSSGRCSEEPATGAAPGSLESSRARERKNSLMRRR